MPLLRNSLLTSWDSKAIMPSLRAMVASSTTFSIKSSGLSTLLEKAWPARLMAPTKSVIDERIKTTDKEPPITMKIEAPLTNMDIGPPMRIPAATIPKHAKKPTIVAKSIFYVSNPLLSNEFLKVQ